MFHMTSEEIQAQLRYCEILFKSGVYSDFSCPEEMFAVVEAGKLQGKPALEALVSLRFRDGSVVCKPAIEAEAEIAAPKAIGQTGAVAAVVETIKQAVAVKSEQAAAAAAAAPVSSSAVVEGEMDEESQEAVESYLSWLEQAKDLNTLDKILYRLKFEEEREHVKAAVRPAFKETMKKLERKEQEARGAVQQSTGTFRAESASKANGNKDLASIPKRAEGNQREAQENVQYPLSQRQGTQVSNGSDVRQTVDNSLANQTADIGSRLGDIISAHVAKNSYDITPSEKKHMIAKIVGCCSTEELFAAAGSIQKYYIKATGTDIMPLLDRLCTERLQEIMAIQPEEAQC